jgi:hypothetical protein
VEPAPTRATSADPSHPDAILTPTRARTPTATEMITAVKDPG